MSLDLVQSTIRRFLSTPRPEVICISGHWGIGKTFAWRKYVEEARASGKIALERYSICLSVRSEFAGRIQARNL